MPSLNANYQRWTDLSQWKSHGKNWSNGWGSPRAQWNKFIRPLISKYLPAGNVLDIGCGYGRWTPFLQKQSLSYTGVDIAPNCIEFCQQNHSTVKGTKFFLVDGMHLNHIEDESIDLIYSFDSLVHVDLAVMRAYVREASRVLKSGGVAMFHHSNVGAYKIYYDFAHIFPQFIRKRFSYYLTFCWRDPEVDNKKIKKLAREHQLTIIYQNTFKWTTLLKTDCITILKK